MPRKDPRGEPVPAAPRARDLHPVDLLVAIAPVVPASAAKLLDQMGVPAGERDFRVLSDTGRYARLAGSGFALEPPAPIFPRLELPTEVPA